MNKNSNKQDLLCSSATEYLSYFVFILFLYNSFGSISSPFGHSIVVCTDFANLKYAIFFKLL